MSFCRGKIYCYASYRHYHVISYNLKADYLCNHAEEAIALIKLLAKEFNLEVEDDVFKAILKAADQDNGRLIDEGNRREWHEEDALQQFKNDKVIFSGSKEWLYDIKEPDEA